MLCEDCHKNPATVIITVTAGGEVTTRHLCQDCMQKMETSFEQGDMPGFISSLLGLLSGEPETPALTCSACGLTFEEFQSTGKLGCAQCYQDFAEQLKPMLLRIHGRAQHAGRVPKTHQEERKLAQCLSELKAQMDKAVVEENFEEAARLRDQIRALGQQTEAQS